MNTELLPRDGLVLCAVSGGADSVSLLYRLRAMGYAVAAAHYNHGLRGEAADRDEAFVRQLCGSLDVPFLSERGDAAALAAAEHMGAEEAARKLRYAFLERAADALGAAVIATAHTADDNAETVLMHLTRGAGLRGLCGIPPVRGRIVRPLLDETHADALAWLAENGVPHTEDETNASDDVMRNRLRHRVMPALRAENPAFSEAVTRTAALLREDEKFLTDLARRFVSENARENTLPADALTSLPRPLAARAVRIMAGDGVTAEQTLAVLKAAASGGGTDVTGMHVRVCGGRVFFGAEDAPPLPDRLLRPGEALFLPEADMTVSCEALPAFFDEIHSPFNTFFFSCANICGKMIVTAIKPGDKYRPAGRGCTREVRRLLREAGIPAWRRAAVPVLRDEAGVLAVPGFGPAERAAAQPSEGPVYKIEFRRNDPCETT